MKFIILNIAITLMLVVGCSGGGGDGGGTDNSSGTGSSGGNGSSGGTLPPQDVTFYGGTLDDLRAIEPSLTFANLTLDGGLSIPSTENGITLTVANLYVNNNGAITVGHGTCSPYLDAPDLTINASGTVNIQDDILLSGKFGTRTTTGSTCNSSYPSDGGNLTINADTIEVHNRVRVVGGGGSSSDGYGTNGGDAGNIAYNATTSLTLSTTAEHDLYGGSGGYGRYKTGNDGADGSLTWSSPSVNVAENNKQNAHFNNAQLVSNVTVTINGSIGSSDDSSLRASAATDRTLCEIIYNGGAYIDFIEDLYEIDVPTAQTITASTTSTGDIDIFLLPLSYCTRSTIAPTYFSNGGTGTETFTTSTLQPGRYFLGVSYSDDAPSGIHDYTLNLTL